jgi:hypothetical protein
MKITVGRGEDAKDFLIFYSTSQPNYGQPSRRSVFSPLIIPVILYQILEHPWKIFRGIPATRTLMSAFGTFGLLLLSIVYLQLPKVP